MKAAFRYREGQPGTATVLPEVCLATPSRKELSIVSQSVSTAPHRSLPLILAALALLVVHASPSVAQTDNPNIVAFVPSPHHSSTLSTGQPTVSRYDLTFYRAGTTETILSVDLGKPAPQADGLIRVDYASRIASWPLPGIQSEARVSAVGPAGAGTSSPSNTFVYNCSYKLSTPGESVAASGGTGMVEIVTGMLCGWSASSSAAWLTVTSGASDASTGWVGYSVAANTGASRVGTLTIAGLTYTVTQAGASSGSNMPPTVRITRPASGSTARLGPPLKVTAEAADADGIAKVEFYANGTLIGTVTKGSYAVNWKLPSAGTYSLTAVAEDRRGARTTSEPVSVTGR
jgi:hypothetical protein